MAGPLTHLTRIALEDSGVDALYRHHPKQVVPGEPVETSRAVFKWYELHAAGQPVPPEVSAAARACMRSGAITAPGLGFVVLHRCGEDFYFLMACTWRGNNEVWETVYHKNGEAMSGFEPWARDKAHKPTFCVWELAAVEYEKRAWQRFLESPRDAASAERWLADRYTGPA